MSRIRKTWFEKDVAAREVGVNPALLRAVNVVAAGGLMVLSLPVLLVAMLAVRLTSQGPVIYRQVRVGMDRRSCGDYPECRRSDDIGGRPFTIYKLRSMVANAEQGTGAVWATANDPRITPVGKILRSSRIDELPQLWNVLRGDMNLVGPRPERPSIVRLLKDEVHGYTLRHRARPGITGLAQVSQAYDSNVDDVRRKLSYDLTYLQQRRLRTDMHILARTVPVILKRFGAN
ncbi:sugar transferase [Gemmatimonas groenlandica]|uniref:Exopolysaccharide biosynthesis protein n=1 Tax=Gemmatimonas groenlandica TaxID=2732249 RepID=A0A6M4IRL1_9BACT|nr:sugar transferase [Gemmatimonas groenlandica]QJR36765.1 exopolysaccharide biosynthesis protein [Gemmatimonas groenlandica]